MAILTDKIDSVLNGLWDFLHVQYSFQYTHFILESKSECHTVGIFEIFFINKCKKCYASSCALSWRVKSRSLKACFPVSVLLCWFNN